MSLLVGLSGLGDEIEEASGRIDTQGIGDEDREALTPGKGGHSTKRKVAFGGCEVREGPSWELLCLFANRSRAFVPQVIGKQGPAQLVKRVTVQVEDHAPCHIRSPPMVVPLIGDGYCRTHNLIDT